MAGENYNYYVGPTFSPLDYNLINSMIESEAKAVEAGVEKAQTYNDTLNTVLSKLNPNTDQKQIQEIKNIQSRIQQSSEALLKGEAPNFSTDIKNIRTEVSNILPQLNEAITRRDKMIDEAHRLGNDYVLSFQPDEKGIEYYMGNPAAFDYLRKADIFSPINVRAAEISKRFSPTNPKGVKYDSLGTQRLIQMGYSPEEIDELVANNVSLDSITNSDNPLVAATIDAINNNETLNSWGLDEAQLNNIKQQLYKEGQQYWYGSVGNQVLQNDPDAMEYLQKRRALDAQKQGWLDLSGYAKNKGDGIWYDPSTGTFKKQNKGDVRTILPIDPEISKLFYSPKVFEYVNKVKNKLLDGNNSRAGSQGGNNYNLKNSLDLAVADKYTIVDPTETTYTGLIKYIENTYEPFKDGTPYADYKKNGIHGNVLKNKLTLGGEVKPKVNFIYIKDPKNDRVVYKLQPGTKVNGDGTVDVLTLDGKKEIVTTTISLGEFGRSLSDENSTHYAEKSHISTMLNNKSGLLIKYKWFRNNEIQFDYNSLGITQTWDIIHPILYPGEVKGVSYKYDDKYNNNVFPHKQSELIEGLRDADYIIYKLALSHSGLDDSKEEESTKSTLIGLRENTKPNSKAAFVEFDIDPEFNE